MYMYLTNKHSSSKICPVTRVIWCKLGDLNVTIANENKLPIIWYNFQRVYRFKNECLLPSFLIWKKFLGKYDTYNFRHNKKSIKLKKSCKDWNLTKLQWKGSSMTTFSLNIYALDTAWFCQQEEKSDTVTTSFLLFVMLYTLVDYTRIFPEMLVLKLYKVIMQLQGRCMPKTRLIYQIRGWSKDSELC